MTFAEVLSWCQKNRAEVRGIYRGKDISLSHKDKNLPAMLPAIGEIFHWDVQVGNLDHYVSSSDFERIVTGKLTVEQFKSTLRGRE
jgi:hypothetical protein